VAGAFHLLLPAVPGVVAALLAALTLFTPSAYGTGRTLCNLPPVITESSGIVASSTNDNVFFTHNDSGDSPRYFAVDRSCRLLATVNVQGASAVDWEDIARGPGSTGKTAIFLGDIGDNNATRSSVTVYEVSEPSVNTATTGIVMTQRPIAHRFTYEDGPHNAETLLVEPKTGRVIVVTKADDGDSGVYVAQGSVLHEVGAIDFSLISTGVPLSHSPIAVLGGDLATGGDVAPDGRRVVVRTYAQAFEWRVNGGDVVAALKGTPQVVDLPDERQGEAIAYTRDGKDLVTTSEGKGASLDLEPAQPVAPATTSTSAPSTSPTATAHAATDRVGRDRGGHALPFVLVGIGAILVGVFALMWFKRGRASAGNRLDSR
jgi:hypothetical protein